MKRKLLVILLTSGSLFAQSNSDITLSTVPSARELILLFAKTSSGQLDPFFVIPRVAKCGDNAIPSLQTILSSQPTDSLWLKAPDSSTISPDSTTLQSQNSSNTVFIDSRNRTASLLYAVMVLESMGTNNAYSILINLAATSQNAEVRGRALTSIAKNYYQKVLEANIVPDKGIVGLFVLQADDTTQVINMNKNIALIARDGIKNWLGQDWGNPIPPTPIAASSVQNISSQPIMSPAQQHSQWWQNNQANLNWNATTGQFGIKQ